ncbi:hypothetical protein [Breoghania sp.]|nr:hypothetical protein [Breoghania sp.]MDJ0931169.1 hypothetical protein [Breoghania sp.]
MPGLKGRQAELHDWLNTRKAKKGKRGQPPVGAVKPLDPPVRWRET